MAEELQDLSKMKVADLKKELKSRGLSAAGNKNELLERLQVAIGDNAFINENDSAVVDSEEILDEDEVLAEDEEEEETLDELSASPEPKLRKLDTVPEEQNKPAIVTPKKIVLNRTTSVSSSNTVSEKENQQDHEEQPKENKGEHEGGDGAASKKIIKLSSISLKERLEMRAQKFGVELSADAKKSVRAARFGLSSPINTSNTTTASSDVLRKRAERFGISSSPVSNKNLSKAEMLEKLEKRKQRFSIADSPISGKKVSTVSSPLLEDEKKKLRAERFKINK